MAAKINMNPERNPMPAQDAKARGKNFDEVTYGYSEATAIDEALRCLSCKHMPCVSGCPVNIHIPEFIGKIKEGDFEGAYQVINKSSSLPAVCGRVCPQEVQCEAKCVRGIKGESVGIGRLERFVADWHNAHSDKVPEAPASNDHRVAVVGSGPSGLAAAAQLNKRGHNVTVYEREDHAGGLLMYGIPNMKLEKHIIDRRIKLMEDEGIKFVTNTDIGRTVMASDIINKYDAVILACGASNPRDIKAEGRDAEGIYYAVEYLKATTKSLVSNSVAINSKYKNVVVIGGGDTGNDCVGTSIRHGCKSVVQLEMMPKLPDTRAENNPWPEWPRICKVDYGQEESVAVFGHDPRIYQTTVKEFIKDENNRLKAIKTINLDFSNGRPQEIEGSEKVIPAEIALIAAGFLGSQSYVTEAFGVEVTERTNVKTEAGKYSTNVEKVFTAGDMHRGQSLVVWAIREGRECAKEVDRYLMGYTNLR